MAFNVVAQLWCVMLWPGVTCHGCAAAWHGGPQLGMSYNAVAQLWRAVLQLGMVVPWLGVEDRFLVWRSLTVASVARCLVFGIGSGNNYDSS